MSVVLLNHWGEARKDTTATAEIHVEVVVVHFVVVIDRRCSPTCTLQANQTKHTQSISHISEEEHRYSLHLDTLQENKIHVTIQTPETHKHQITRQATHFLARYVREKFDPEYAEFDPNIWLLSDPEYAEFDPNIWISFLAIFLLPKSFGHSAHSSKSPNPQTPFPLFKGIRGL